MGFLFSILAAAFGIAGFIGWILILIEAFKDELWKGFVGLLCWIYLLYFALFDFEHENKWPIVILAFGGSTIAAGLSRLS